MLRIATHRAAGTTLLLAGLIPGLPVHADDKPWHYTIGEQHDRITDRQEEIPIIGDQIPVIVYVTCCNSQQTPVFQRFEIQVASLSDLA